MDKSPARRLKVYAAHIGFFDTVVAAPNQTAALAAWGVRQNLFAEGRAQVTTEADALEPALAHPGTPMRRAAGTKDPFTLEPNLPDLPNAPRRPRLKVVSGSKVAPARPRPDRSALAKAEKALAAVNQRRIEEETDIEQRRAALEAEDEASQNRWRKDRKAAEKALALAHAAYADQGGAS